MSKSQPIQHGVILEQKKFSVCPVLGTKDDGKFVIFPPLTVPNSDVIAYFDSEAEANLWVCQKELEAVRRALASEEDAHAMTKQRARALMAVIETFKGALL